MKIKVTQKLIDTIRSEPDAIEARLTISRDRYNSAWNEAQRYADRLSVEDIIETTSTFGNICILNLCRAIPKQAPVMYVLTCDGNISEYYASFSSEIHKKRQELK